MGKIFRSGRRRINWVDALNLEWWGNNAPPHLEGTNTDTHTGRKERGGYFPAPLRCKRRARPIQSVWSGLKAIFPLARHWIFQKRHSWLDLRGRSRWTPLTRGNFHPTLPWSENPFKQPSELKLPRGLLPPRPLLTSLASILCKFAFPNLYVGSTRS